MFKNHTLLSFDEYISTADKASRSEGAKESKVATPRCRKHPTKDVDLYCLDCEDVACSICFASDHHGHQISLLGDGAKIEAEKLQTLLTAVDASRLVFESATALARQSEIYFSGHLSGLRTTIRSNVLQLCKVVSAKGEDALRIIDDRTADLRHRLASRRECLEGLLSRTIDRNDAAQTFQTTEQRH